MALGSDLLALPFPDVVAKLAMGIAEAQSHLDKNALDRILEIAQKLAEPQPPGDGTGDVEARRREAFVKALTKLRDAGILPTFYQFLDTELEIKMAISTSKTTELEARLGLRLSAVTVDAGYSQKFSYSAEGSSVLRTKLVPMAPPEQLKELLAAANEHKLLDLKLPGSLAEKADSGGGGGTGGGGGGP
jgi:hypothetical protein